MINRIFMLTFLVFLSGTITAQLTTPAHSPAATATQKVGLTDITISYSRPSVKGRKVFGADGLIPYGKLWRTGANAATKISFSDEVSISDHTLPKGDYAILTMPQATSWQVHFYPYEKSNWNTYAEATPLASVTVKVERQSQLQESMSLTIEDIKKDRANLHLSWENVSVNVPIKMAVHELVLASIDRVLAGPSVFDYYFAADYLLESGEDLNRALSYIQKATGSEQPRFFFWRCESLILAKLNRKTEAIKAAENSMELAKLAGNEDFVRLNEKSIREWKK